MMSVFVSAIAGTHLVEVISAPLCRVLSCMSIEDSEETLPAYVIEVDHEGMCILHGPPGALVFRDSDLIRRILGSMSIQDLRIR